MGASIFPVSGYHGSQYDISILVWKVKNKRPDKKKYIKKLPESRESLTHGFILVFIIMTLLTSVGGDPLLSVLYY